MPKDEAELKEIVSALVEQSTQQKDLDKYVAFFSENTDWQTLSDGVCLVASDSKSS